MNRYKPTLRPTRRALLAGLASAGALGYFPRAFPFPADAIASTTNGKVRGIAGKNVLSFRGVPYGAHTAGANRFRPPTQPAPWKDIRDASKAGPRAMQVGNDSIFASSLIGDYFSGGRKDALRITHEVNSENCLVLNVLTPQLTGNRPVMIYIHGGGFDGLSGALTLIADRFVAEHDVVLVGVNHRLNVFGYTYLGAIDSRYPDSGNAGQLDLIAALKWVRDNIENFGGDPGNVTLFGESGGGSKISALLAMPDAQGLFHRAIIESGSYALQARTSAAAAEGTKKLLAELKLQPSQIGELWTLPPSKLLSAFVAAGGPSGPVVDGRSLPHQTWTPGAPPEALGVSLIIGCCQDEMTLFRLDETDLYSLDWPALRTQEVKSGIPEDKVDTIIARYRADYPGDSPSDLFFRIATDRGFRSHAIAQANAKLAQRSGDVYMYYFAWNTQLDHGRLRAFHTAELPLVMRLVSNPEAEELSKQIAGAWATFARNGDPNHAGLPPWEKYSLETRTTMVFDANRTAVATNPAKEELTLLERIPELFPN